MAGQKFIEYLTWNGQRWKASLEDLKTYGGAGVGFINPSFHHHREDGTYSHKDEWIQYIADNGTHWRAKCRSHSQASLNVMAKFTFDHYEHENGSVDHSDTDIRFRGWDGNNYKAYIADIPRGQGMEPFELAFQVERV